MEDLINRLNALADRLKEIGMEADSKDVSLAAGIIFTSTAKGPEPKLQRSHQVGNHLFHYTHY